MSKDENYMIRNAQHIGVSMYVLSNFIPSITSIDSKIPCIYTAPSP